MIVFLRAVKGESLPKMLTEVLAIPRNQSTAISTEISPTYWLRPTACDTEQDFFRFVSEGRAESPSDMPWTLKVRLWLELILNELWERTFFLA